MLFIFTFVSFNTKLQNSFYVNFREHTIYSKRMISFALRLNQSFTEFNELILATVNSVMVKHQMV